MTKLQRNLIYLMLFFLGGLLLFAGLPRVLQTSLYQRFLKSRSDAEFVVTGFFKVIEFVTKDGPPNVTFGDWAGDCSSTLITVPKRQCFSAPVIKSDIAFKSANCGSTAKVETDPKDSKCVIVTEYRRGCGEDNILGIKNCKGRGWLDYTVSVYTSQTTEKTIRDVAVAGIISSSSPLNALFQPIADSESNPPKIVFKVTIKDVVGNVVAELTEGNPSTGAFSTVLDLVSGKFTIETRKIDK